ncbi:MAG: hypothetical protein QOE58_2328 [Actinomycetota bacterium]|nr:hypothetical protein [Actinomycetota bacterium]
MSDEDPTSTAEWLMDVIGRAANASQPQLADRDYYVTTESAEVHDVHDLRGTLARVNEPPKSISVCLTVQRPEPENSGTVERIQFIVGPVTGGSGGSLAVSGPDVDETHGFFDSLRNQVDTAVKVRLAVSQRASQHVATPTPSLWKRVLNSQYSVQIIGGTIAALLAAGLLAWHPWVG